MSEPYVGEIRMFGGNYAPSGWALCNGQLLPIGEYQALYALIGTTYGGNGTTTFALPDLQGRIPVGEGSGPGLTPRTIGQSAGSEMVTLTVATIPGHSHPLLATKSAVSSASVTSSVVPGAPTVAGAKFYTTPVSGEPDPTRQNMAAGACAAMGGSQPHDNIMPSLCVSFIISLSGIYPTRS